MTTQAGQIQLRRDTLLNWITNNPILAEGEFGYETDTGKGKFGNGVTPWTSLPYCYVKPTASSIVEALGYTPVNPANNLSDISDPALAAVNLSRSATGLYLFDSGNVTMGAPKAGIFQITQTSGNSYYTSIGGINLCSNIYLDTSGAFTPYNINTNSTVVTIDDGITLYTAPAGSTEFTQYDVVTTPQGTDVKNVGNVFIVQSDNTIRVGGSSTVLSANIEYNDSGQEVRIDESLPASKLVFDARGNMKLYTSSEGVGQISSWDINNGLDMGVFLPTQCVNTGYAIDERPAALSTGSGLYPKILASEINMTGNNQSGQSLRRFIFDSDFEIPSPAPANRRSSVVLLNGSTGDPTTDATKWDYSCQRRERGPLPVVYNDIFLQSSKFVDSSYNDGIVNINNGIWASNVYPSTLEVAYFGINVSQTYGKVKQVRWITSSLTTRQVSSVRSQYSTDNGVTWLNIATHSVPTAINSEVLITLPDYDVTTAHKFRILANANTGGSYWYIYDIHIRCDTQTEVSTKNCLITFTGDIPVDKYNNHIQILNNPSFTGGKYVGNGTNTGIRIHTIKSLGLDSWCIEFKVRFASAAKNYDTVVNTTTSSGVGNYYGFVLLRNSAGQLEFYASSNGASWNIASSVKGTKNNFDSATDYHIVIEFTGTAYKVYVDGVLDINVTSSSPLYALYWITFGCSGILNYALSGTLDNIRITIGNTRYNTEGFLAPIALNPDMYWEDTANNRVVYGAPSEWVEREAVFIGEITTSSNAITNTITYAYNRKIRLTNISVPTGIGMQELTEHNFGYKPNPLNTKVTATCIVSDAGWAYGDEIPYQTYGSSYYMSSVIFNNEVSSYVASGSNGMMSFNKLTGAAVGMIESSWKLNVEIDESR